MCAVLYLGHDPIDVIGEANPYGSKRNIILFDIIPAFLILNAAAISTGHWITFLLVNTGIFAANFMDIWDKGGKILFDNEPIFMCHTTPGWVKYQLTKPATLILNWLSMLIAGLLIYNFG